MSPDSAEPPARKAFDALHLFALGGFAVAEPLFHVLARDATFFVARSSRPIDLWALSVAAILLVPASLVVVELLVGLLGERVRRGVHLVLVALLAAAALMPATKSAGDLPYLDLALAMGSGLLAAFLVARWQPARTLLSVASPAPLLFAALFLWDPSIVGVRRSQPAERFPTADVETDTTVVVLVLDELPLASLMNTDLTIDADLFPSFARLASESTWFRNATASAAFTNQAIPAILTGLLPEDPRHLPTARFFPKSLFTLLGGSHRIEPWESMTALCPWHLVSRPPPTEELGRRWSSLFADVSLIYAHVILPGAITAELPSIQDAWGDFGPRPDKVGRRRLSEDQRNDRSVLFRDFVGALDGSEEPGVFFLHVRLPHQPWIWLPSGRRYDGEVQIEGLRPDRSWGPEERPTILALQQHLLQLGHVDRLLGELMARLESTGMYDRSLLVVMADHGTSFETGELRRRLSESNLHDILHAPLFVKEPFQREGRVDDRNVESIDVLPAIADALDVVIPWPVDGRSPFETGVPERAQKTIVAKDGTPYRVDGAFPERWPLIELKERAFGIDPRWEDVFSPGDHADLLGKRLEDLDVPRRSAGRVELFRPDRFAAVDLETGPVPSYLRGTLWVAADGIRVAVAIDGVVRSVTTPWAEKSGGKSTFVALVPDGAFRAGANRLEVLTVDADGRVSRLDQVKR